MSEKVLDDKNLELAERANLEANMAAGDLKIMPRLSDDMKNIAKNTAKQHYKDAVEYLMESSGDPKKICEAVVASYIREDKIAQEIVEK